MGLTSKINFKGLQIGKDKVIQFSLFVNGMIWYLENPKESKKIYVNLAKICWNYQDLRIQGQYKISFLYIKKQLENEMKNNAIDNAVNIIR